MSRTIRCLAIAAFVTVASSARADLPIIDPLWRDFSGGIEEIAFTSNGEQWLITNESRPNGYQVARIKDKVFQFIDGEALKVTVVGGTDIWVTAQDFSVWRRDRVNERWISMPGLLTDVEGSVGGQLYGLGFDWAADGYDIWKWTGETWIREDGRALKIAVDPEGVLWRIRPDFSIQKRDGHEWVDVPGQARDIAIGDNGVIWSIGATARVGGFKIYRFTDDEWRESTGGAVKIFVDRIGAPHVVNVSSVGFSGRPYRP
jgi:hypothetical protein